jgi:hypothetical protein
MPNMTSEKMDQSATEAQRAIVEHFIEPAARKKFRKNLQAERMYAGSTEAIDLNYLVIRIRELEMDDRYRPMGELSLKEETARIMRAGEDDGKGRGIMMRTQMMVRYMLDSCSLDAFAVV